jgi:pSer/pThr/pTyr-binding forkhead associated (FHA) protein
MVAYAPPTVPAYLLSLLANRLTALGDAFAGQFEGHWLIWEPGQWSAGGIFEHTKTPHGTRVTGSMGDSLSFHLKTRQLLKLGRSSACDIVINDGTVSREHLTLEPTKNGDDWVVRVLSAGGVTSVGGVALKHDEEVPLRSGAALRVGDVALTYLDVQDLVRRLRGQ